MCFWKLLGSHLTGLGFHLVTEDVQSNSHDDNGTDDDVLDILLSTHQVQTVVDDSHQQSTDQSAPDGALAAGEGGAADDTGSDGVIVVGSAAGSVGGSQTADTDDTGHTCHEAGQGVNKGQNVLGGDAGQTGSLGVTAAAVDLTAQSGLAQEDVEDDEDQDDQHEAQGDSCTSYR